MCGNVLGTLDVALPIWSMSTLRGLNIVALREAGGHASQSLWSWTPAAQLSLLRSAAKVPVPVPVHSLHPAAASGQHGSQLSAVPVDGPLQLASAGATAQPQASVPAAEATAASLPGPLVVFADGSVALVSLVGDELRLGPVAAAASDAAADDQVRAVINHGSMLYQLALAPAALEFQAVSRTTYARAVLGHSLSSTVRLGLTCAEVFAQIIAGGDGSNLATAVAAEGESTTVSLHRRQVRLDKLLASVAHTWAVTYTRCSLGH